VVYGHTVVISRKHFENASGKFLSAIFDTTTSLCFAASMLVTVAAVYVASRIQRPRKTKLSLPSVVTYVVAATLCQSLPNSFKLCNVGRTLITFYTIFALIMATVFSGESFKFENLTKPDLLDSVPASSSIIGTPTGPGDGLT